MFGFPSQPQGHWGRISRFGNQNKRTQATAGISWIGLVAPSPVWRMFQYQCLIYSLCEDGAVIPRYFSEEVHQDKMVLNLYDTHLSYVTNVPAYLQKYHCDSYGQNFRQLIDWKRHQGCCANATEYEFPGGFHKISPSIFDRLEEFRTIVPFEECLYPWLTWLPLLTQLVSVQMPNGRLP